MKTKTQTVNAWLAGIDADQAGSVESLQLDSLVYCKPDISVGGWLKVGTAVITVTYEPANDLRQKAAEAIRAQMQEAAAKYQAMQTELQERLNKLLAIGYEVAE